MKKMETEHGDSVMVSEEMDGSLFDPDSMVKEPEGQEESRLHGKKEDWRDGIKLSHFRSDSLELDVVEYYKCSIEPLNSTEKTMTVELDMHKNEANELFNCFAYDNHHALELNKLTLKPTTSTFKSPFLKSLEKHDCYDIKYKCFMRLVFVVNCRHQ